MISPYKASGHEMARFALSPQVAGVVDVAPQYRMEELEVMTGCQGEGRKVADILGGAVVVAIRFADGRFQAQPAGETVLRAGDVMIAMGALQTMERLESLLGPVGHGQRLVSG